MEELKDLKVLAENTVNKFSQYTGEDFILPQIFKDEVKEINGSSISYNKYSAIIETSAQLNIYMPNQWFFIASYFTELYHELHKYKKAALSVTSKERLKDLNGKELSEPELKNIEVSDLTYESKERLKKFITDYSWWGGAKTIDRNDFYVSPILSYGKLVNASQSYVADLCAFLADKEALVSSLRKELEANMISLKELFAKYLNSLNLAESTANRYLDLVPNYPSVVDILKNALNKNNLFEIDSISEATQLYQIVKEEDFNKKGNNLYSSGIKKYINFLEWRKNTSRPSTNNVRESFIKYWEIIDQHGAQFELYVNRFESVINAEIKNLKIGVSDVFEIVDFEQYKQLLSQIISNNPDLAYLNDDTGPDGAKYYIWSTNRHYRNYLNILAVSDFFEAIREEKTKVVSRFSETVGFDKDLLTAMRTKPFLLLAGISGTGKSRIVKQMAFESCPDIEELRSDKTSPGNYQLIEVKPNWHDSTEVLGYESEIGGKHYVATPFVKFLVKAMCYPDVPFFVCMDEMNLAPVEQYFAEFLSVLESRKLVDGKITSEPLIKADIFKNHETQLRPDLLKKAGAKKIPYGDNETSDPIIEYGKFNEIYERLKVEGLRIPSNLIVVGTVNMDETTHQFSRKVIDRAMTIEMNIEDSEGPFVNFFKDCKDLDYSDTPQAKELFLPTVVQAKEALANLSVDDTDYLEKEVPTKLYSLNQALNGTPFKIAYRVQNELVLYFHELRKEHPEATVEDLLSQAMDAILMLKVLPRIEGDEDLLEKPLEKLHKFTEGYTEAHKKVEEMQARLNGGHFTSFWP